MKRDYPTREALNATPVTLTREAYQATLDLGAGRPVDAAFADACYNTNTCAGAALAGLADKDADTPHAMIGFPRFAAAVQSLATVAGIDPFNRRTLETAARVHPTARAAFKALTGSMGAPLMDDAKAAFEAAKEALREAQTAFDQAAFDLLRAGAVETSKRYPRREVQVCAAMGTTNLTIERKGGYKGQQDYVLSDYVLSEPRHNALEKALAPGWLKTIYAAADEFNISYALGGDQNIIAKGGRIVRDLREW